MEVPLNIGFVGKKEQTGHPAQKPIKVIEPLILMTTQENDLVLDPMCGSGTTGVVCEQLNRRAILCDMSSQWIEVTKKRLIGK
jgi:site-specific DNA-methyltransferase (adenine-specific)